MPKVVSPALVAALLSKQQREAKARERAAVKRQKRIELNARSGRARRKRTQQRQRAQGVETWIPS